MANELTEFVETGVEIKSTEFEFKNYKLKQQTKAIEKLMLNTKRSMFEIAIRLSVIQSDKLYEADGFKDVFDYADKVLSYKKNMVYKMVTVADKFIEESADGKGYISIITHDDSDYTVSQLIELNSLDNDTVIKLDENEVIEPDMTTKEIREVVKEYKNGIIDEEGNEIKSETEVEETEGEESEDGDATEEVDPSVNAIRAIISGLTVLTADERFTEYKEDFKKWLAEIMSIEIVAEMDNTATAEPVE